MSIKKSKTNHILSADTFFYTIPLTQPGQRLTGDILAEHHPALTRKAFMGNHCEYISYAHGILRTRVFLNDGSQYDLSMHVGVSDLHVACSCGMPDEKLCRHAFIGLRDMLWRNELNFGAFYWPGYESDEKIQRKFLQVNVKKQHITVEPQLRYGNIFKPGIGFAGGRHLQINEQPALVEYFPGKQEVMAYCLCYSFGNTLSAHLPAIIPCLGITKDQKQVSSFLQFHTQKKPVANFNFSANQQQLNAISARQHELTRNYDDMTVNDKRVALPTIKAELLELWKQALPLLVQERFTYSFYIFWLKFLYDKPRKTAMRACRFSLDKPLLSFVLKFHGDHFSLTAEVTINGEQLDSARKPHCFVFDDKTGTSYLMQTVQDDDLFMWLVLNKKRLTILKAHFREFQKTFLEQLSRCYSVSYINRSGKRKKYDFDEVIKDTAT